MPKEFLPIKVDPFRFADNATRVHGNMPISKMERLVSSLASDEGDVAVDMNFGVDEQGLRFLSGHLETQLVLQCQRCLEPFNYKIIGDFHLGIVRTEEKARDLPARFDPLVIKGDELFIQDVVEDELIISLPIVSLHDEKDCKIQLPLRTESDETSMEKNNPFKVIELLRTKRDNK